MLQQEESSNRLESLLGSLIKMLGKTNEKVDNLEKRIQQMEWIIREAHFVKQKNQNQNVSGQRLYAYVSRKNS